MKITEGAAPVHLKGVDSPDGPNQPIPFSQVMSASLQLALCTHDAGRDLDLPMLADRAHPLC